MKKTFFYIAMSAVFVLSFVFVACNRNTKEVQPNSPSSKQNVRNDKNNSLSSWRTLVNPNPNNPYNYVGILHNEGLDNAISRKNEWLTRGANRGVINYAQLKQIVSEFSANKAIEYGTDPQNYGTLVSYANELIEDVNNTHNLPYTTFDEFHTPVQQYANLNINENVKNYMLFFENITGTFSEISLAITTQENAIIADNKLSVDDKNLCLASCAVFRYSLSYWQAVVENPDNSWNEIIPTNSVQSIAGADLGGAITGGIRGAIKGAACALVFGPGGSVLTCGYGMVNGAIWSSCAAAGLSWFW